MRLLSQAHTLKINRDHRARLVSSNRKHYDDTILLLYAGDIRVSPRVSASGPEPAGAIICTKLHRARPALLKNNNLAKLFFFGNELENHRNIPYTGKCIKTKRY